MNSDELSKIAVELDGIFDNMPIEPPAPRRAPCA